MEMALEQLQIMKITKKDVEYVANLARIEFTEQEKEKFTRQLGKILEYMDKLNKLDTGNVPATSRVLPLKNVFREDESVRSDSFQDIISNAPEKEGNYFKIKKVIE